MKINLVWLFAFCAAAGVMACGPSVSTSQLRAVPARPKDCELELVQEVPTATVGEKWTIVGYVIIGKQKRAEPLSEKNRELVRPKACAMGGEAIGVALSATNQAGFVSASSVAYAVLVPTSEPQAEGSQKL